MGFDNDNDDSNDENHDSNSICYQDYCDMGMDANNCWLGNWCQDKSMGGCPPPMGGEQLMFFTHSPWKLIAQNQNDFVRLEFIDEKNAQDQRWRLVRISAPTRLILTCLYRLK